MKVGPRNATHCPQTVYNGEAKTIYSEETSTRTIREIHPPFEHAAGIKTGHQFAGGVIAATCGARRAVAIFETQRCRAGRGHHRVDVDVAVCF